MAWMPFEDGSTVGQIGSDGGVIVLDHEHTDGARIEERMAEVVPSLGEFIERFPRESRPREAGHTARAAAAIGFARS
jgi:hypothetical protein